MQFRPATLPCDPRRSPFLVHISLFSRLNGLRERPGWLFVTQSNSWINPQGSPRREIAGKYSQY